MAKYGAVPPYRETQNYLRQVANQLEKVRVEAAKRKEKEVKPAETTPDGPRHIRQIVEPDGTVRFVTR